MSALAGVLCPPRKACLLSPNLSPNLSPTWLCLSPWVGCCVRLAGLVSQFVSHLALSPSFVSPFVSHLTLSFTLAGVLCPPRWACLRSCLLICLPICLLPGFVFHLGWGAASASLGLSAVLSPNLSPIWLCLPPSFVSAFVPRLALPFTLAGVLCPPRWACPVLSPNLSPIWLCLPVFGWGAVSASLGLSSVLSPNLSPNLSAIWLCLPVLSPHLFRIAFVFHLGWGAVSASLGLSPVLSPNALSEFVSHLALSPSFVSPFVSHLTLSFTLAGLLCPPRWACLPICLPPGFVFHLGWGAVSASLGLSPNLSPNLSPIWLCLSPWLGCCVRLTGLVCGLVSQFVSHLALSPSFVSPFVSHLGR